MENKLKDFLRETLTTVIEDTKKRAPNVCVSACNSMIKLYQLDNFKESEHEYPRIVYIKPNVAETEIN